jgi:hypothetical protein
LLAALMAAQMAGGRAPKKECLSVDGLVERMVVVWAEQWAEQTVVRTVVRSGF